MGTVIEDKDKAVGHQDHNGKRYYFCCGGCPDQFKDNPSKFEDGKAIN
ncbi:MAG: YHS domain-containing protein [Fimbriimonadaceae bacterium]|nr:YHS domain-containing protein [Fimbriimonadaceae bacterium]